MATTITLTATPLAGTVASTFVAGDLDNIKIGTSTLTQLNATLSTDKKTITIPSYGTITATGTGATMALTFAAASTLTGDYAFADVATNTWAKADFSAATLNETVKASAAMTTILTGTGADKITGDAATTSINGGAGNDDITSTISGATITGGAGNDAVTLTGDITDVVLLGDGDDTITVNGMATTASTVTGGAGKDTYVATLNADKLEVTDLSYTDGDSVSLVAGAATPALDSATGKLTAGAVVAQTTAADNVYKAKVTNGAAKQEYWTAAINSANVTMDASAVTVATAINASGATNAVISGGTAADTITLGASTQATVSASRTSAKDIVTNFNTGFTGDVVNLSDGVIKNVTIDNAGVVSVAGAATASLDLQIAGAPTEGKVLMQENGGTVKKVAFSTAAGGGTITADAAATADVYLGKGATTTVDYAATYTGTGLVANLQDASKYVNITSVTGAKSGGTYIGTVGAAGTTGTAFDLTAATVASAVWGGGLAKNDIKLGANAVQDTVFFGTKDGADTVTGFAAGFGATSDVLYLYDVADASAVATSLNGANAVVKTSTDNLITLTGSTVTTNSVQLQVKNAAGTLKKVAYGVADNATIVADGALAADGTVALADAVIGKTESATTLNTVKYGTANTNLVVNLLDTSVYKNIHSVDIAAATGSSNVVIGSADTANGSTITLATKAGATNEAWGGSSAADTFVLGAGTAKDTVWYGAGDGKDTINNFINANDTVKFYDKATVSDVAKGYTFDGATAFTSKAATSDVLTVNGLTLNTTTFNVATKDKTVKAAAGLAALTYDKDAKLYFGNNATLTVNASSTEVDLYLGNGVDGNATDVYFSGVNQINASAATGKTVLIGANSQNNTLIGGAVSSEMWGGGVGSDTMTGSTSAVDKFWFGSNDGNDKVTAADKNDTIVLYNAKSIDDVKLTADATGFVVAQGSSTLTVADGSNVALTGGLTFQVGTGTSAQNYTYNTTTGKFAAKA